MLLTGAGYIFMRAMLYISGVNGGDSSICVLRGSSVDLPCSVQHYSSNRKWHTVHDGHQRVQKELFVDETHVRFNVSKKGFPTLTINDVRENDANLYCCSNDANDVDNCWQSMIELKVSGLKVRLHPVVATEGQTVQLTCSTSCPLPGDTHYIWYLNNRPLILQNTQTKHLILDPVSIQYAGHYYCCIRTGTKSICSSENTLTVQRTTGTPVAAVGVAPVVLIPIFVYLKIRKKRPSSQSSSAESTGDTQLKTDHMSEYENMSAQSAEQDEHQYNRLHFPENQTADLYCIIERQPSN